MALSDADSTGQALVKGGGMAMADRLWSEVANALQAERARLTVWSPLLLVLGIWTYFSLVHEPPRAVALLMLAVAVGGLLGSSNRLVKILAIILLGFAAAQLRTAWVATPLLRAFSPAQTIEGIVSDVDVRGKGRMTLTLDVTAATGLLAEEVPKRAMIHFTGKLTAPRIGEKVEVQADLAPLPRPAQPGGFDYGRQLYFQSIGAVGRSKIAPRMIDDSVPMSYQPRRSFHDLRAAIGARVHEAIHGPLGSFADAVITGERASIPRSMNNSLQISGLFHILSISGLHMALVAGGAFWVTRAMLALSPRLALRYPIKKWAAVTAIFVGALYMLLADSGAATERSFIMIAVVFWAMLVNRPALSMHNLAVAAILILISAPEQALAASFQMSFMAVMGLAAFFAWWSKVTPQETVINSDSALYRYIRKLVLLAIASLATSLVAGGLSSIPALHHFGRLAPYGIISNALALPVISFIVMPMAMLGVLLMPLGLESLPLQFMGWGLEMVMLISDEVASWPAAAMRLPQIGAATSALLAVTAAFALLPYGRVRWLALPMGALALTSLMMPKPAPLLLIDERVGNIAIQTEEGLVPALATGGQMSVSRWLAQAGETANFKTASQRRAWNCTATYCKAESHGFTIGLLRQNAGLPIVCPQVDVLVAQEPLRRKCRGARVTIDRFDVWRNGAYAVSNTGDLQSVRSWQGLRPWVVEPRARTTH